MDSECLFCKIIKREIPSSLVFENDKVLAFNDVNPVAPVHVLIIPKKHLENLKEIDESNISCILDIHTAAIEIAKNKNITDYRLITNCGKGVGQTVFHLHYHLIGGRDMENLV